MHSYIKTIESKKVHDNELILISRLFCLQKLYIGFTGIPSFFQKHVILLFIKTGLDRIGPRSV